MEKATQANTHYTLAGQWPTGVKRACEVAPILGVSEERLIELAEWGCIPHWRIDGGEPLFYPKECKEWVASNIMARCEGNTVPVNLRFTVLPEPALDPPPPISDLENLRQMPVRDYVPGVYFLCLRGAVVYVGQSVSPLARIMNHRADAKDFDAAYLLPVPRSALNAVEGALIRLLEPPLNRDKNGKLCAPGMGEPDSEVLEEFAPQLRLSPSRVVKA